MLYALIGSHRHHSQRITRQSLCKKPFLSHCVTYASVRHGWPWFVPMFFFEQRKSKKRCSLDMRLRTMLYALIGSHRHHSQRITRQSLCEKPFLSHCVTYTSVRHGWLWFVPMLFFEQRKSNIRRSLNMRLRTMLYCSTEECLSEVSLNGCSRHPHGLGGHSCASTVLQNSALRI